MSAARAQRPNDVTQLQKRAIPSCSAVGESARMSSPPIFSKFPQATSLALHSRIYSGVPLISVLILVGKHPLGGYAYVTMSFTSLSLPGTTGWIRRISATLFPSPYPTQDERGLGLCGSRSTRLSTLSRLPDSFYQGGLVSLFIISTGTLGADILAASAHFHEFGYVLYGMCVCFQGIAD